MQNIGVRFDSRVSEVIKEKIITFHTALFNKNLGKLYNLQKKEKEES